MTLGYWLKKNRFQWYVSEDTDTIMIMRSGRCLQFSFDIIRSLSGGIDGAATLEIVTLVQEHFEAMRFDDTYPSIQEALDKRHALV
jgi:hypothetical protein